MRFLIPACVVIAGILPTSVMAANADFDAVIANIMAANVAANTCSSVQNIGDGNIRSYILAASELAAGKGVRKQKLRKHLFYGEMNAMQALGRDTLARRGVPVSKKTELCKFANKVAGTDDPLGRFLRK